MKYRKGEYHVAWRRLGTGSYVRLVKQGYLFDYLGREYGVAKEPCDMPSKVVWVVTDVASGRQIGINSRTRDAAVGEAMRLIDSYMRRGCFDEPSYLKMCENYETLPEVYK